MDFHISLTSALRFLRALKPSAIHASSEEVTSHLRRSFCDFQREYVNYSFQCARLHRHFKHEFKTNSSGTEGAYRDLVKFVDAGFQTLCGDHATCIRAYFLLAHRPKVAPSVGIHIMGDYDEIVNVAMISGSGQKGEDRQVKDYTVFERIVNTGLPYLDNNIPKTVKGDLEYKHGSLHLDRVKAEYRQPITDSWLISRFRGNILRSVAKDKRWPQFWKGEQHSSGHKSNLAVPITFRQHAERNRLMGDLVEVLNLPDDGRSILGFLLIDHPATYYFDDAPADSFENLDVNILYLYADTLSLPIVTYLTYTKGSDTVRDYEARNGGGDKCQH